MSESVEERILRLSEVFARAISDAIPDDASDQDVLSSLGFMMQLFLSRLDDRQPGAAFRWINHLADGMRAQLGTLQ